MPELRTARAKRDTECSRTFFDFIYKFKERRVGEDGFGVAKDHRKKVLGWGDGGGGYRKYADLRDGGVVYRESWPAAFCRSRC